MFRLFKRKSKKEKLLIEYNKLMDLAFKLSHIDRKESNFIIYQADQLMEQIIELSDNKDENE